MKKIIILLLLVLSTIILWANHNDWQVEQSLLDNNETSYTLNYRPNRGKPLLFALNKIEETKAFHIRVMLPYKDTQLQKELRAYYTNSLPKELNRALKSSRNLHNPTLLPLIEN